MMLLLMYVVVDDVVTAIDGEYMIIDDGDV